MRDFATKPFTLLLALLCLSVTHFAIAQEPPAEAPPANVAGKWTTYSRAADGQTATKYIELTQNVNTLSVHFKGPERPAGSKARTMSSTSCFGPGPAGCSSSAAEWKATRSSGRSTTGAEPANGTRFGGIRSSE